MEENHSTFAEIKSTTHEKDVLIVSTISDIVNGVGFKVVKFHSSK